MKKLIVALVFLFLPAWAFAGQTLTTVSVTSSTAGTQIVANIGGGCVITVPSTAAVPVWIARTAGTCSTALTSTIGIRISLGNGYEFDPRIDQYSSQLCGLLDSGSTAVTVSVNCW